MTTTDIADATVPLKYGLRAIYILKPEIVAQKRAQGRERARANKTESAGS
jgi:hypothetical protein